MTTALLWLWSAAVILPSLRRTPPADRAAAMRIRGTAVAPSLLEAELEAALDALDADNGPLPGAVLEALEQAWLAVAGPPCKHAPPPKRFRSR